MTEFEQELAYLLVAALELEDIRPEDIDPQAPLFREGLGLDSIDALEIALAVSQHYGVQLQADAAGDREAFTSLAALAQFITAHRTTAA